jgi:hypothetical protein|tara:strand:- start:3646 stop:4506 length:861 start_codon:yes stop_codon:yes gene_type:complete
MRRKNMPLDFTAEELIPEHINFPVEFEPTKYNKSKYVINGNTGDYLGIVGTKFNCVDHGTFFTRAHNAVSEHLGEEFCDNMNINFRAARNNAWTMMDMVMPNVLRKIQSDKHTTTIAPRLIALHGIDGSCSNQVYFGSIDFFCTNGMITGDFDQVKRKNTSNFDIENFIKELKNTMSDFNESADKYQSWAEKHLYTMDVKEMLGHIMSKQMSEKMFSLYNHEAATRGQNVWALYSAFTNYSSHSDTGNGFALKNTGNDTQAENMWKREQEVAKWTSAPQFRQLVAA